MVDGIIINTLDSFLRENTGEITVQTLKRHLFTRTLEHSVIDLELYLKTHPLIFQVNSKTFISRASVFTDKQFSIKPTKTEISMGILIPGHRCFPFLDPDIYPHEIIFFNNTFNLKKKTIQIPLSTMIETCFLYGEEYLPQLLSVDPANKDCDFTATDYALPNIVSITVWDMQELYTQTNFSYGDRLLAKTVEWKSSEVELQVQKNTRSTPFEITEADTSREKWFTSLNETLLDAIMKYGPLGSIEEQLAYAFFSNTEILCTDYCCSVEEYMEHEGPVGIEYYGVESRLWVKGEEIPAVGSWNEQVKNIDNLVNTLYDEIGIPIPFYMLDAYIFDSLYRKEINCKEVFTRMIPDTSTLNSDAAKSFKLHIENRYDKMNKKYNRFLDFEKGKVRSRSLELYSALIKLICELDSCSVPVASLPQQQLVIVSQLFSHTTKFLEAFMSETNLSKDDLVMIDTSLDGMTESFEEVAAELTIAMGNKSKHGFTIVD